MLLIPASVVLLEKFQAQLLLPEVQPHLGLLVVHLLEVQEELEALGDQEDRVVQEVLVEQLLELVVLEEQAELEEQVELEEHFEQEVQVVAEEEVDHPLHQQLAH